MADRFDAVVVGSSLAGSLSALALGAKGRSVLLIASGPEGEAALPGGVVWRSDLSKVASPSSPNSPLERRIVERRLSLLTEETCLSVDYRDLSWAAPGGGGWVVERSRWERWAREQGPRSHVEVVDRTKLEGFGTDRSGKLSTVKVAGKEVEAEVLLLQDPASLPLAQKAGVGVASAPPTRSADPASIVEHTYSFPRSRVDDRFGGSNDLGFTLEAVLGFLPQGALGYGYLYPGGSTVHVGVVAHGPSVKGAGLTPVDVLRRFESHVAIAPFLRGGADPATATYLLGAVPRGTRRLYGDGFLVIGDAATVSGPEGVIARSMDAQVLSALLAAETANEALEFKDATGRVLSRYATRLSRAGVLAFLSRGDLRAARLKWNPRLHRAYPALFAAGLRTMMTEKGQPKPHTRELLKETLARSGIPYTSLALDALAVVGSL